MAKKKKGKGKIVKKIAIVLLVLVLMYLGYSQYQYSKLSDEEAIRQEFENIIVDKKKDRLYPNEELVIRDLTFENNWAIATMLVVDKVTGKSTAGGPTIVIFRKLLSRWIIGNRSIRLRKMWVESVPETLIPSDLKMFLR